MSDYKIVRINENNYEDFLKMIHLRITGKKYGEESSRDVVSDNISYSHVLRNENFFVYAAIVNNEMLSYIAAAIIPKADRRIGTMFIDEVWTHKSARGIGLAKALVAKVMDKARELEIWEARLTVDLDNDVARHIYRSFGFKEKECIFGRVRLDE